MKYNIILESFEGPLDLLYHLIEKEKVDIYDIPISKITDQYIAHIETMKELDLDVTSEFLVMAATLLEIKSKMLLPVSKKDEGFQQSMDELDPRVDLVRRLIEYKKYKDASEKLKSREELYSKIYYKAKEEIEYEEEDIAFENIDLDHLIVVYKEILKKCIDYEKEVEYKEIARDKVTIEESIDSILDMVNYRKKVFFEDLFQDKNTKAMVVVTFLALLELIKQKLVSIKQEGNFARIVVELKNTK
ncbi:segregation and condensation protein A [Gottschalkia acidurici 9a]|uniref:Segregation and condensation protein A n=1 Tax=Gottschalkia acidurici (strain ATCC 7906 / DSM 604 / BCRC 14475 / CIP 104303 / KCTC 5404 / NCIMB 10678 / 9a) TaxID=1128398 RepID=K0B0J7_GOTA9|nr:segregation/condensation protein A [Gottschalkia acidurici]AFS78420.1 segregation and condensation protein A [Gottschalkia acidurici 9a]